MTTMTREQRIARANEIFDYVWGREKTTGDNLSYVSDEVQSELRSIADDFENVHQGLSDSLRSLRAMLPDTDEGEEMSDELDLMDERMCDIEGWLKPMRELADRLAEAMADYDADVAVA